MAGSSIVKKKCKCSQDCNFWPTMSYEGYYAQHAPAEVLERLEKKQDRKKSIKKDLTKVRSIVIENFDVKPPKDYAELDRWFKDRQKKMTGRCLHCNGKTEAYTKLFKCSIAHILPKAYFKSVATHPDNWIELCFYGKSCHTNFDNHIIDIMELNCFDIVIERFVRMYPFIAPEEKRRIPDVLLQYVEVEK